MKYVFIKTHKVCNATVGTDMKVIDLDTCIKEILGGAISFRYTRSTIRVSKINDEKFGTKLFKELYLNEFEDAFGEENIQILQKQTDILNYDPENNVISSRYPIFRKEIYLKYGNKISK